MEVKRQSQELSKQQIYFLSQSPEIKKMRDAAGQVLDMAAWMIYTDTNSKGEEQTILSILTADKDTYATNSRTFIEQFEKCIDIFGGDFKRVSVGTGTSKGGRTYLTATYAL